MKRTGWRLVISILIGSILFTRQISAQEDTCANPANPIVAENCLPGTDEWLVQTIGAIEGYVSRTSALPGETLDFFINTTAPQFDLHIYRSGYYDGLGGRLIQSIADVTGIQQPACFYDFQLGLTSCGAWQTTYTLTIPDHWLSGIYIVRMVRQDDGGENFMLFVVRDDERPSDILYQQSETTYQAYNYYGSKSLYNQGNVWNACITVTGETRAAAVSFNRPYQAPMTEFNMYFHVEYPLVSWLEQQGYDVSYSTNLDTHNSGKPGATNQLLDHQLFIVSGHDEYWSEEMRTAITAARDAGVNLAVFSSNTAYWRVRFEPDPETGEADAIMVSYKTAQSGPVDPSGISTSTYRDPAGPNNPENALLGIMYTGDNSSFFYPIQVTAEQAQHPLYRNTGLQDMPPGSVINIGERLVGWEWDSVVDNGFTPPGLTLLATSPIYGKNLLDEGQDYTGIAPSLHNVSLYTTESGAQVFASGTNHWAWGLAIVEPNPIIQQVTYNLLAGMNVLPTTPVATLVTEDETGEVAATDAYFFPEASQPPVITDITTEVGSSNFVVRWQTDSDSRGQVWYGTSPDALERWPAQQQTSLSRQHEVRVDYVRPGQTFYYQIIALNANGRATFSEVASLQTTSSGLRDQVVETIRPLAGDVVCAVQGNPFGAVLIGGGVIVGLTAGGWSLWRRQKQG